MFCPHCGTRQADDARFCEKCGGQLALDAESSACEDELAQAGGFIPSGQSLRGEKRRASTAKRVAAIGAAVVLVVAVALTGYGFATGAFSGKADQTQTGQVGGPSQESASHDAPEAEPRDDAPDVPDLSDENDYLQVNLFLSNFSEANVEAYDSAAPDAKTLARFALYHEAYNNEDVWEFVPGGSGSSWFPVSDSAGYDGVENGYNVRVPSQVIVDTVRDFLKIEFDPSILTGDYHYEDGYVYFQVTNGTGYPSGVAVAQEIVDQGSGRFAVRYDVYGGLPYNATDTALYGLSEEEIADKLGAEAPSYSAEAVLETGYDGELAPFKLISLRKTGSNERGSQESLVRYRNARFGFFLDVPATASVTESDNGAGMTCVDETGSFRITTWASNTVATTLSQSFAKAKTGHDVAYEHKDDECYVVSYEEDGSVFYVKEYVGSGSLCGVQFEYPESESERGDKLVERLVKTFTPGDLTSVH